MAVKDLVSGTLAGDITTSTTNILVHIADNISAQGITDFFPTAPFYITIMPKSPAVGVSNRLDSEILQVTAVGNDQVGNAALTCVRGQRDTTAKAFEAGSIVTVGVYAEDAVFLSEDGTNRKQLKDKDGNTIYPDVGLDLSYSETEHKTGGTWIDGKPIYKKTVYFGNLPNNGEKTVAHGISNLGYVVKIEAVSKADNSFFTLPLVMRYVAIRFQTNMFVDSSLIHMQNSDDRSTFTAYVTIYYTKSS